MAPDRALFHAANRLPDILTGLDIRARKQGFAARGFYCLGNGRCLLIDLLTKEQPNMKTMPTTRIVQSRLMLNVVP